jgi:hypothetical protein
VVQLAAPALVALVAACSLAGAEKRPWPPAKAARAKRVGAGGTSAAQGNADARGRQDGVSAAAEEEQYILGSQLSKYNYKQINTDISRAARDPRLLSDLVTNLCEEQVSLDVVNVCTLLHRIGRARLDVSAKIITFLTNTLEGEACREEMTGQKVGNALYGLQHLGNKGEVRRLVAA